VEAVEITKLEIALQLYSLEDDYYDNNGYDNYASNNNGYLNNIVEELEYELQLLWDTFSSLTTTHTFIGHQLYQLVRTTTSPQLFKLVGSKSPGGVHSTSTGRVNCGRLHLYTVFGLTPPAPTVSRFNQPRLRLHTGQRHGPRAPTTHLDMMFLCGT